MPTYSYKAKKITGEEVAGTREAKDTRDLGRAMREEGYTLIRAVEAGTESKGARVFKKFIPSFFGRVSLEDKMMFARNLGVMIKAGLALTKALEVLEKQTDNAKF